MISTRDMCFGEEDERGIVPFYNIISRVYTHSIWYTTVDVNLAHLAEKLVLRFLYDKVSTVLLGKKLLCATHT